MDLETLCGKMEETVRRAGAYVRTAVPQAIDEKSGHSDLVTEYDVQTQRMLMEELSALYPEAEFMGEEEHLQADVTVGDCFVIDPIDGTANFVAGYNRSAVSVALLRDGQPVLGMVYHPWAEEFFSAIKGKGAFLNGRKLTLSDRPLADSLVGFGSCPYYRDLAQRTTRILGAMLDVAPDIRRMGSAALDLCDIAAGRTGAFFELKLSPWDYAAAGLIAQEAGAKVFDLQGEPLGFSNPSPVVAGAPSAAEELRTLINKTK